MKFSGMSMDQLAMFPVFYGLIVNLYMNIQSGTDIVISLTVYFCLAGLSKPCKVMQVWQLTPRLMLQIKQFGMLCRIPLLKDLHFDTLMKILD